MRSIPACAGEPRPNRRRLQTRDRVYPRVCGGTRSPGLPVLPMSSLAMIKRVYPRVCGGTPTTSQRQRLSRSIPACAGEPVACAGEFSLPCGHNALGYWVYPRVCGGTSALSPQAQPLLAEQGLSPRVRGNPPLDTPCSSQTGSIPACAGEPAALRRCGSIPACAGEPEWMRTATAVRYGGLSPRVRGNQGTEFQPAKGLSPRVRGNLLAATNRL